MTKRLVVRVANAQGVSESHPEDETRLALTLAGEYGVPDVVLLSEVSWCNVANVALRHAVGSGVVQYGERGTPEAGVAVVARLPIRKRPMLEGSPRTSEGGGIRMRPIVGGTIAGWCPAWAIHAPPPRSPQAQANYVRRARQRHGIVGGDWNYPADWMHEHSARQYRGIGVLGLLVPDRLEPSPAKPVNIGSDHPAVDVVLTRRSR